MVRGKSSSLFVIAALLAAIVMAVLFSPWASSFPDGLEKIAERMGFLHQAEGKSSWEHSPMPDYAMPGIRNESLSTGLAGLLGTVAVFGIALALGRVMIKRRSSRHRG